MKKIIVYTALFGDIDELSAPDPISPGIDYICFTDRTDLESRGWKIVRLDCDESTPRLMNRKIKFLPHLYLPECEISLYIDSNIAIRGDPLTLLNYLCRADVAVPKHKKRNCVYWEAIACFAAQKISIHDFMRYLKFLRRIRFPKNLGLTENGIILRRTQSGSAQQWGEQIWLGLSTLLARDQLIAPVVQSKLDLRIQYLKESAHDEKGMFEYMPHIEHMRRTKIEKAVRRISYQLRFSFASVVYFLFAFIEIIFGNFADKR